jgi:hypothetical protein
MATAMSNRQMFSILSTSAPLVEVVGEGPVSDLRDGLVVPDGTVTIAPAQLRERHVRCWRVDAPLTSRTLIVVNDSPFGAFVSVRRQFATASRHPSWLSPQRWPRLRHALKGASPSVVALWHLFADNPPSFAWQDVDDGSSHQAVARGGDVVTVTFVVVREERRHA